MTPHLNLRKIGNRKRFLLLLLSQVVVGVPSFMSIVSFCASESRSAIASKGCVPPEGWPSGVFNHGTYYGWWRISDNPILFALSIAAFVVSSVPFSVFVRREKRYQKKHGLGKTDPWFGPEG